MIFAFFILIAGVYLGQEFKQIPSIFLSTKRIMFLAQRNNINEKGFISKVIEYVRN